MKRGVCSRGKSFRQGQQERMNIEKRRIPLRGIDVNPTSPYAKHWLYVLESDHFRQLEHRQQNFTKAMQERSDQV